MTGAVSGDDAAVKKLAFLVDGNDPRARTIQEALSRALQANPPHNFEFENVGGENVNNLASLEGKTSTIALAAAIDRERVAIEKIENKFKLVTEVAAQALFFDALEKQAILSYPLTIESITILEHEPTEKEISAALEDIILDTGVEGFVRLFTDRISNLKLPEAAAKRMQFVSVTAEDGALTQHPKIQDAVDSGTLAQEYTKYFGDKAEVGLLPSSAGSAIKRSIALKFSDASSVFNLEIPQPDYSIHVRINRLIKKTIEVKAAGEARAYGAYFTVTVNLPSGKPAFSQQMKVGLGKEIPAGQTLIAEDAIFYDALLVGISKLASATQGEEKAWQKLQPGGKSFFKETKALATLIEDCRR